MNLRINVIRSLLEVRHPFRDAEKAELLHALTDGRIITHGLEEARVSLCIVAEAMTQRIAYGLKHSILAACNRIVTVGTRASRVAPVASSESGAPLEAKIARVGISFK